MKTNFHTYTNFWFKRVVGFVIEYSWISKLLRDVAFTWRPRELSCRLKKVTYFGEFCYRNSSCIRKSITLMFMSSSRNKFTLFYQNSKTDFFVGFRPPCWCSSRWATAWRLHINLYINLGKTFLRISRIRNIPLTWILARVFVYVICTSIHFPDSGLYLLNGFYSIFRSISWMAWLLRKSVLHVRLWRRKAAPSEILVKYIYIPDCKISLASFVLH